MLLITSFLETISIGILLPILEVIIEGKSNNETISLMLSYFTSSTKFETLTIVLILFGIIILLKNIIIHLKNKLSAFILFGLRGYWMNELMNKYLYSKYDYIVGSKQGTLINNILVESEKALTMP